MKQEGSREAADSAESIPPDPAADGEVGKTVPQEPEGSALDTDGWRTPEHALDFDTPGCPDIPNCGRMRELVESNGHTPTCTFWPTT